MSMAALFRQFALTGTDGTVRQFFCLLLVLACTGVHAESIQALPLADSPQIAIIIDDLGNRLHDGQRVVRLPGQVTLSIMPFTPFARRLALLAHHNHREIMLHLPMESVDERYLGRGGLDEAMNENAFDQTLQASLEAVPDIAGVNNHMGSRLTQDATRMGWFMDGLLRHGELYFVDSRTTARSQADTVARQYGLEHARRDVFLDDDRSPASLQKQWNKLLRLARRQGSAIAIGHPYPETIHFLQQVLPTLANERLELVPVSALLQWRQTRRSLAWQTQPFSSPLPRAVKSSKP